MNLKKQITYIGDVIITYKNITNENMNNERYNEKPIYEVIPFECQASDYAGLKQHLFLSKFYKQYPTNTYIHNLKIHKKKIIEFYLDYLKGYCQKVAEREEIVNTAFSSQYLTAQTYLHTQKGRPKKSK